MELNDKITASTGKVFKFKHNDFILGKELYVGNIWIDETEIPFSMDLVEEINEPIIEE